MASDAKSLDANLLDVTSLDANSAHAKSLGTNAAHRPDGDANVETSAGGVVFRVAADGEPLFLIIRDSYRNWGFPKGHLEIDESASDAAIREVREETGLDALQLTGAIDTIDWFFRFRGKLVHKVCHFYLMRAETSHTTPQRTEGITACRWEPFARAIQLVSYANARDVLTRAQAMVREQLTPSLAPAAVDDAPGC